MFILSLLITYAAGIPLAIALGPVETSLGLRAESLSLWVMRWGPTFAGLIVLAAVAGRRGFAVWWAQLLRWRVPVGYYFFVYASALLLFVASLAFVFGSLSLPPLPANATMASVGAAYAGEIAYITLTNGEETGWRFVLLGLLLPRMRLFSATLIVGGAWVLWHLPMYLFLGGGGLPMFAPFVAIGIGLSILLSWLYKATDSLLLPVLFHGAVNATTYSFERHFPDLASALEARGPVGEWAYVAALLPVVLAVLLSRRQLFFGPVRFRDGENWAGPRGDG
jgi:membrane protease YdiL (CAAX protease family)